MYKAQRCPYPHHHHRGWVKGCRDWVAEKGMTSSSSSFLFRSNNTIQQQTKLNLQSWKANTSISSASSHAPLLLRVGGRAYNENDLYLSFS